MYLSYKSSIAATCVRGHNSWDSSIVSLRLLIRLLSVVVLGHRLFVGEVHSPEVSVAPCSSKTQVSQSFGTGPASLSCRSHHSRVGADAPLDLPVHPGWSDSDGHQNCVF